MQRITRSFVHGLAGSLLLLVGIAPRASGQVLYEEVPGRKEFTGQWIAKPWSVDDWIAAGRTRARAEAESEAARRVLETLQVLDYVPQTDEYVFAVPGARDRQDVAAALLATGRYRYVEPNWLVFPIGCPNDPDLSQQWHHDPNRMDSCAGWDTHTGTPSFVVGYCDTGVLTTHEDLQLHRQEGYDATDEIWESAGGNIDPVNPHGTWVTGCGSGNGDNAIGISGVGWNLGHRMLRVSDSSSGSAFLSVLQHAARTSVEAGDKVASVSYSGVESASNLSTATYVKSIGGLVVWAAGNDGNNLNFGNRDADDLIVAGATDENDNLAGFSNFGPSVDLTAPGNNIYTTGDSANDDYDIVSGTSFATPLTAGLIALIWSYEPSLTPDDVEFLLKRGCEDLGAAGVDDTFGYGRIDVVGALEGLGLRFSFPNGLPPSVQLTGGTTLDVDVQPASANPVAGTGLLHVNDGLGWRSVAMSDLGPGRFQGVFPGLPGADCGDAVQFYVSVDADDGNTYSSPFGAPTIVHVTTGDHPGFTETTLVDLDFEADPGWTVEDVNVTGGSWDRAVPAGGGDRGDPAADFDGSGQCWLTESADGNTDVDGGPTRIVSTVFDVTGFHSVAVRYARWFSNDDSDGDRFDVEMSADGGVTWVLADSVGNTGGWVEATHAIEDTVPLTNNFRIRFSATDDPNDSVTEAAVDAFRLIGRMCPLKLDITPEEVGLTGHVDFNTWTGTPGRPMVTFVVDVNGIPTILLIDSALFDATGRHELGVDIPNDPILVGLDVTCITFGFDALDDLVATNQETLQIQ